MKKFSCDSRGFSLIEVLAAVAVFLIFAIGVYGGINMVFKIVYQSRMTILETALLSEELEIARNLPYDRVGIVGGVPAGDLTRVKTVSRNGKDFQLITTVRNIDDPFDGTIGGAPRDLAPADYKLVEMSAICLGCVQQKPVILSTTVSPKNLEGATQNGAVFINVFDAAGLAVAGAGVRVENNTLNPTLLINDTTDNEGMLRLIDLPTSTLGYDITVGKDGYSTDRTYAIVPNNAKPVKLPVTVATQTVTEISFSIDRLGSLDVRAINTACAAIGWVPFRLHGGKLIGTEPDVFKYDANLTTDGSGGNKILGLEWDKYHLDVAASNFDLAGAAPLTPLNLTPGLNQEVALVLRPRSENSLLVKVKDAGTGLPLSKAIVRLSQNGYDETLITGLGYSRQTDWSGGSGQERYETEDRYWTDSGTLDTNSPAGDVKLKRAGGNYLASGWLESSTFDLGTAVSFNNIVWEPWDQPPEAGQEPIAFQIAASDTSTPAVWDFVGPDGVSTTYYTATSTLVWNGYNGNRYLRYKLFLHTEDENFTPALSEVAFTYTNSCTPPGQSFFFGLSAGAYNLEVTRQGYITDVGTVDVAGAAEMVVNLSVNE